MCRRAFVVILAVAISVAAFVRLRLILHSRAGGLASVPAAGVRRDVGAAMRLVTGTDPASIKPWVADEIAFANAHPDRQWIVGRSGHVATSEAEALESAHADAARQIEPIVESRLKEWSGDRIPLRAIVDANVSAGRLDRDTFIERFDRPYGTVYADAVLIELSADQIDRLVQRSAGELAARHRRARMHVAIAGGLLIFTWLGYALLNSLTRGYVTGRLRVIAAAVSVGVLLLA